MNIYLIEDYIKRLTQSDIERFALKQGIILDSDELNIVYNYRKKEYKTLIYGNPKDILLDIKTQVKPLTYTKIENLYLKFKGKIDLFTKTIRDNSY